MISHEELNRLERLAKEAHQGWGFNQDGYIYYVDEKNKHDKYEGRTAICRVQSCIKDFDYIITFNPSQTMELIEEIRRLKSLVGEND